MPQYTKNFKPENFNEEIYNLTFQQQQKIRKLKRKLDKIIIVVQYYSSHKKVKHIHRLPLYIMII